MFSPSLSESVSDLSYCSAHNTSSSVPSKSLLIGHLLAYKSHFLYSEIDAKIEWVLHASQTNWEGIIWHNLGGNIIILFSTLIMNI